MINYTTRLNFLLFIVMILNPYFIDHSIYICLNIHINYILIYIYIYVNVTYVNIYTFIINNRVISIYLDNYISIYYIYLDIYTIVIYTYRYLL